MLLPSDGYDYNCYNYNYDEQKEHELLLGSKNKSKEQRPRIQNKKEESISYRPDCKTGENFKMIMMHIKHK